MATKGKYSKELIQLFSKSEKIVIVSHHNPDGDAVGSMLSLYHLLQSRGAMAEMISPNALQHFLNWLDGADKISVYGDKPDRCNSIIRSADLIIMVDFNDPGRLAGMRDEIENSSAYKLVIDHHPKPIIKADLIISDPKRCSTTELIHSHLFPLANTQQLSTSYYEAIYSGIITDTGNFVHGTFDSDTMVLVGEMLKMGIDRDKIYDSIYNNFSESRMRLQGYAVDNNMVLLPGGKVAYISLTMAELEKYNYEPGDTEGFVNIPLSIAGVEMTALFVEKRDHVKASFRSKGLINVREFAALHFSGGGHDKAAGGETELNMEQTIQLFINASEKFS